MRRLWILSVAVAPGLVFVCLAWMFFYVEIAALFAVLAGLFSGYVAGRLDDPPRHSIRWSLFP